jgi:3'(2'), 5'-bisphosphate nucleotidase
MKKENDPVTATDFKIQSVITQGLRNLYPEITIVGEEQLKGETPEHYQTSEAVTLPTDVRFDNTYDLKDVCIWIDPIDNTRGFIEGSLEAVTVLIGLSYKQKAEIGFSGLPYKLINESEKKYSPSVLMGCSSSGFAYEFSVTENSWMRLQSPKSQKKERPIIAMSPNRKNIIERLIMEEFKGEKVMAGGVGYKIVLMIQEKADFFPYCRSNTCKWDTCAGEAIIRGLGGYFSDEKGEEILYDPSAKNYDNSTGMLCGFAKEYQEAAIQQCKNYQEKDNQ